jgi:hypothetical protein
VLLGELSLEAPAKIRRQQSRVLVPVVVHVDRVAEEQHAVWTLVANP